MNDESQAVSIGSFVCHNFNYSNQLEGMVRIQISIPVSTCNVHKCAFVTADPRLPEHILLCSKLLNACPMSMSIFRLGRSNNAQEIDVNKKQYVDTY